MKIFLKTTTLIFPVITILLSCKVGISAHNVNVIGRIITDSISSAQTEMPTTVTLVIASPILASLSEYEALLQKDGTFTFSVPVVHPVYARLSATGIPDTPFLLIPGTKTELEITKDHADEAKLTMLEGKTLTKEQIDKMGKASNDVLQTMISSKNNTLPDGYDISPSVYRDGMTVRMEADLESLKNNNDLPEDLKRSIDFNIRTFYLTTPFDYEMNMHLRYSNSKKEFEEKKFTPIAPDRSYYSFLKHIDFNEPPIIQSELYAQALQSILSYKALEIPAIDDTPVNNWIEEAKAKIADLVGLDSGIFYDLLAANAYSKQINSDLEQLSDKQKENIQSYFSNKAIIDVLFAENEKIKEISRLRVNTVPDVPNEKLLDSIVARYKGKVVLVDFWATWCNPCLHAIATSKEIKNNLKEKEVVFVYITGPSSSTKLWQRKVLDIPGEHYYLNKDEWGYISDAEGIKGIPHYILFDPEGTKTQAFSGYPGNEVMQQKIEELLPNEELTMVVGTYTSGSSKGIYTFRFNQETGESQALNEAEISNPSYLTVSDDGQFVYAVSEHGDGNEKVTAFRFDASAGVLEPINSQPAMGADPCYIISPHNNIITANYSGGSIAVFPIAADGSLLPADVIQFEGSGIDKKRQEKPHLHCVQTSPDGNFLFANDLGTDRIHVFEINNDPASKLLKPANPPFIALTPGSGPRHITFSPNGKQAYLINELSGAITVFDYNNGVLSEVQSIQADTVGARGSADIHISPDGKFLYASNRLQADGLAIFSINTTDGKLTKTGYQPTGAHPRNFIITPNGKYLLVASRDNNAIEIYERDKESGLLTPTGKNIRIDKPVCLKFAL